jgi:hypothetical protein
VAICCICDSLGVHADNLTLVDSGDDALAVLAKCVPGKVEQIWKFAMTEQKVQPSLLGIAPCNASSPEQQWNFSVDTDLLHVWTPLQSLATGQCVDYTLSSDPLQTTADCTDHKAGQAYTLRSSTGQISAAGPGSHCLDVYNYEGPDVESGGCKKVGGPSGMTNQQWTVLNQRSGPAATWSTGMLQTRSEKFTKAHPMCLAVTKSVTGGLISTTDGLGRKWYMTTPSTRESNVVMEGSARSKGISQQKSLWQVIPDPHSPGNVTINGHSERSWQPSSLGFANQFGASGPLPHTRYLQPGRSSWTYASSAVNGAPIKLASGTQITDDDGIGGVKDGTASEYCIELSHAGNLEAWHAPLSDGRAAVAFVNRSPAPNQAMTLELTTLGLGSGEYTVRDIWAGKELPSVSGSLPTVVKEAHGTNFYILTPSK